MRKRGARAIVDIQGRDFNDLHIIKKMGLSPASGQMRWLGKFKESGLTTIADSYDIRHRDALTIDPIKKPLVYVPKSLKEKVLKLHEAQGTKPPTVKEYRAGKKLTKELTVKTVVPVRKRLVDGRPVRLSDKMVQENRHEEKPVRVLSSGIGNAIGSIAASVDVIRQELQNIRDQAEEALNVISKLV